ncbi:MAG: hypothetical protein ACRDHW_23375, partial [Ktedonobacteraceae bacterium]
SCLVAQRNRPKGPFKKRQPSIVGTPFTRVLGLLPCRGACKTPSNILCLMRMGRPLRASWGGASAEAR